jgi:hypothetical protein
MIVDLIQLSHPHFEIITIPKIEPVPPEYFHFNNFAYHKKFN